MVFTFGQNWREFSRLLDADRLSAAEDALRTLLERPRLDGLTMIDVGAGSGLFAIAAVRLGARSVVALDRDLDCVAVISENARRFLGADASRIEVLTADVLAPETLPARTFDLVYAWGSLHHTGAMWQAIRNAAELCGPGGRFALAIYNRTWFSPAWLRLKRLYRVMPRPIRVSMVATLAGGRAALRVVKGRQPTVAGRGMSVWYDAVDWLGGLPYECASPRALQEFLARDGFTLESSRTTRRHGCNEFVFARISTARAAGTSDNGDQPAARPDHQTGRQPDTVGAYGQTDPDTNGS